MELWSAAAILMEQASIRMHQPDFALKFKVDGGAERMPIYLHLVDLRTNREASRQVWQSEIDGIATKGDAEQFAAQVSQQLVDEVTANVRQPSKAKYWNSVGVKAR